MPALNLLQPDESLSEIDAGGTFKEIPVTLAPDGIGEVERTAVFVVPEDYTGSPQLEVRAVANANGGQGVRFPLRYFVGPLLDPADWLRQGGLTMNFSTPMSEETGVAAMVAGDLSPGTTVVLGYGRDRGHADDTLPAACGLRELRFLYA